jgi:hypothetical protein
MGEISRGEFMTHVRFWLELPFLVHFSDRFGLSFTGMDSLLMILQYKLHIFTPLGHLRSTFMIDSNSNPSEPITISPHLKSNESSSDSSKTTRRKNQKDEEELTVAGGGLGIRCVAWKPDGKLLAIGGYDDKVSSILLPPLGHRDWWCFDSNSSFEKLSSLIPVLFIPFLSICFKGSTFREQRMDRGWNFWSVKENYLTFHSFDWWSLIWRIGEYELLLESLTWSLCSFLVLRTNELESWRIPPLSCLLSSHRKLGVNLGTFWQRRMLEESWLVSVREDEREREDVQVLRKQR